MRIQLHHGMTLLRINKENIMFIKPELGTVYKKRKTAAEHNDDLIAVVPVKAEISGLIDILFHIDISFMVG